MSSSLSNRTLTGLRSCMAALLSAQMLLPYGLWGQMDQPPATQPRPETRADTTAVPPNTPLTPQERVLHLLDRFTYGPTPGEVERVTAMGMQAWLALQMSPQKIDDSALEARLADYPAIALPLDRMMEMYPTKAMIRQEANGKISMSPGDEAQRAIYADQMARERDKKANGSPQDPHGDGPKTAFDPDKAQKLLAMPADQRFSALCRMNLDQIRDLRQSLRGADRDRLTDGFTPHQLETVAAFQNPQAVVGAEIPAAKLLRDIYSERQMNEVMVDFWLNHFNVYIKKSQQAPYYIAAYERTVVRPRALGRFEDLLVATAMSPAMLNYLDNSESVGPHSQFAGCQGKVNGKKASGLNENYARELMELHTLGVGGGYTQHDVTEVAKVFTGWTVGSKRTPMMRTGIAGFDQSMQNRNVDEPIQPEFDESKHEPGTKVVLGVTIKENGEKEGLEVLHLLATNPATAKFIAHKLAVRFVSDDPPQAVVDRMAAAFTSSGGDIRQVMLAMINSPEFWARSTYRAKVKTPQDFVVSAIRASGADVAYPGALVAAIADLGMPLYGMQTPNGYSMRADPWNNTGALVSRMNFALALSSNHLPGVTTDWPALVGTPGAEALTPAQKDALLEDKLLHIAVSERTRKTILNQIGTDADKQEASLQALPVKGAKRDPLVNRAAKKPAGSTGEMDAESALAAGLLFGSPEFQRR